MDANFELTYHALEVRHWWFCGRRQWVQSQLRGIPLEASILEIGCSSGVLLQRLQDQGYSDVQGIDISSEAIRMACDYREVRASVMDAQLLQYPDAVFDCLIASDVLEHLEHDKQALGEWFRVLRPGGKLILGVPAFQWLWSAHDDINYHYRRYSKSQIKRLLQAVGFSFVWSSYWNFLLFFPVVFVRMIKGVLRRSDTSTGDLAMPSPFINGLLKIVLVVENCFLKYSQFPLGVSVVAVGFKNKKGSV